MAQNLLPKTAGTVLWWIRHDLRLGDNPALVAALGSGAAVVPVFIFSPEEEPQSAPGAASRWWLHQSLTALDADLRGRGSRLVVRQGPALRELLELASQCEARAVFWNRRYEPDIIARDSRVKEGLRAAGLDANSYPGALLTEPWETQNKSGKPFQVFTPFWRNSLAKLNPTPPQPPPTQFPSPSEWPKSVPVEDLALLPRVDWAAGLRGTWTPGESGAWNNLKLFLEQGFHEYAISRNRPDLRGTARLSPHLHFGEISPRQIWHAVRKSAGLSGVEDWKATQFITELGWREFSHHLLYHFPHTVAEPLRTEFSRFPWRTNVEALEAWQEGRTGYPIVDAGMRELWQTGWMHNRVRMIVASFLVKDLLISWQAGAAWFWDTLVDADLAQNTLGWQWTAGCGADAAPFFRVFNPVSQGEKFDPDGNYVRHFVPELSRLPAQWIHQPHLAPAGVLERANVLLGQDYPYPIINHTVAREQALAAFSRLKS